MLITKNKGKGALKKAILVTGLSLTLLIFALHPAISITSAEVVINEFEQNPPGHPETGKEWVELFNNGSEEVDISGWTLVDGAGVIKIEEIPQDTILSPFGYFVINLVNITLNQDNENITLKNATGAEIDKTLTASDNDDDNRAWARNPNGYDTDSDSDWRFQISTRGVNNEHDVIVAPNTTVPGTIRDYNFTITNNYKGFEIVKIELPANFIFLGNRYSITSDIPLFDTANVTTGSRLINITNVNFANGTDGWVKVDDIRVNASDSFNVTGYNSTHGWENIGTPQINMTASPAAQNLTVHVIPSATVGNPQTIYVQAQNASGYLSNTTNISVLLKVNSSDASLTGGITEKEIYLVNGENSSVKINSTKKGAYKITAYDLSITETPLQNGSDTIIYEAAEGYRLRFNQTSAAGFAGENVSLRLFTEDIFENENSSITDQVFLRVESPSGNAKLTYVNEDITPVYGGTYDLVNGSLTIKVIDPSIETATLIADDISGTPPHLISATTTINFTSGNITEIQVLPSADSNRTVNSTLQITAQLLDPGGNNVSEGNVSVNFSLAGNITTLPGFENGTLSAYSVLTNENGTAFTLLTLPTQEGLKVNVTVCLSTDASINGTSGNFTTINDTVCQINISSNGSDEDDNIVKASDQEFFEMNVTLQDKYGNRAEESRVINYSSTFGILSKANGTTTIGGIDTLKIRSLYPGNATVIANSSGLLNGSIEVWFYGLATKINVTANNSTAGTAAVATIRAVDVNNLTDESFTDTINVTVSGNARIYNGTNTTIVWNNSAWNETALTLDYKGNGTVLVNDSTAETIGIGVWSSGLTSENTTITFSPNVTVSWLNASAPINNTTIENSLQVIIEANGASGNLIDCSLPVTVSLNNTIARITSTTLSNSYIYPNGTLANGTLVNGTANVTITGTTIAGCVNVTPDCAELDSAYETNATIQFFAGPYTQVNITTNRRYVPANGTDNATLTASLIDEYGNANLTDNVTIDLKTTFAFGTLTQTDNTTDNGMVYANLSSTKEGTATIYANTSDPQITKINNATVTFVGNATNFTLAASKAEAQIGENVTITVQVVDTDGNPVSEQKEFNLTNSSDSGNAQLYYMNGSGYTNGINVSTFLFNGTYTFTLSDETPEIVTLSLNTSSGLTTPSDISVTFNEFTNIITLREDWNLVSVPKTLAEANDSPSAVFSLTAGEITWHYNAGNETWVYPDKIEPCKGYWVYKKEQKEVRLSYKNMTGPEMPPSVNLYVGWDMIGHTSVESMAVNHSLVSIDGKYDIIFKYNGTWHSYIAGVSSAQDFANLTPAQGYWIRMKENATFYAVSM